MQQNTIWLPSRPVPPPPLPLLLSNAGTMNKLPPFRTEASQSGPRAICSSCGLLAHFPSPCTDNISEADLRLAIDNLRFYSHDPKVLQEKRQVLQTKLLQLMTQNTTRLPSNTTKTG